VAARASTLVTKSAHKPMGGAPAYSRYLNRPLGRRLALLFVAIGLSPNAVTAVSASFTFPGLALIALARPSAPVALVIVALLLLGYAVDSADGQVARMTGAGSPAGEWLDHIVDSAKMGSIHLLVLIHLYRFHDVAPPVLLLPLAFSVVSTVLFFGMLLTDFLRRTNPGKVKSGQTSDAAWRSFAALPSDYGLLCLVFGFLPWTKAFLAVYGLVFVGTTLFLAVAVLRWWRGFSSAREVAA
jgi:phosphatidylglycerophosphate synthase